MPPINPIPPNEFEPATHASLAMMWGDLMTGSFTLNEPLAEPVEREFIPGSQTIDLQSACISNALQQSIPEPNPASISVGRYAFGKEIGRGGVGAVHEGWDTQLAREIAVKLLLEDHKSKPEVVRRFLQEARITSRLQHPGIVAIHELGFSPDARPFFVMRLIRGQTLEEILRRRENPSAELPRLLNIFHQVCQAVAYAHSERIIHRDLKPANIMVGAFGVVKVMDWGLAKVLDEPELPDAIAAAKAAAEICNPASDQHPTSDELILPGTQVGMVFGTPAYLAPEQARGQIDIVDKRVDVFGLGSILCEILTGRPPYTGADGREVYVKAAAADTAEVLARLKTCHISLDLISLATWCLATDPEARPKDAAEVVEVMTAHLEFDRRRAERDMSRFFDLSPDLFCIASLEGYFVRVNQNFPRVLGYTAEELTTRPFVEFVHPEDRAKTDAEVVKLAAGCQTIRFLNRYRHARGHYLWFEWSAQWIPEERAIYAAARDVTDRVERGV